VGPSLDPVASQTSDLVLAFDSALVYQILVDYGVDPSVLAVVPTFALVDQVSDWSLGIQFSVVALAFD